MPSFDYYHGMKRSYDLAIDEKVRSGRILPREAPAWKKSTKEYEKFALKSILDGLGLPPTKKAALIEEMERTGPIMTLVRAGASTGGILGNFEEWIHYATSNHVILIDNATIHAMSNQRNKVVLDDIDAPIPLFEIATERGSGVKPMLVILHNAKYKSSRVNGLFPPGYVPAFDEEVVAQWINYGMGTIAITRITFKTGKTLEDILAKLADPTERLQVAVAYNFIVYTSLEGHLPMGKAHGRPRTGIAHPTVHALLGMDGVFRSGFWRTLKHQKYYRGLPYPPPTWRHVKVRSTFVGDPTSPAHPGRVVMPVDKLVLP